MKPNGITRTSHGYVVTLDGERIGVYKRIRQAVDHYQTALVGRQS